MSKAYNYIILNGHDNGLPAYNEDGYYSICLRDLWENDNVQISNYPCDACSPVIRWLFRKHHTTFRRIPLKRIWFHFFAKPKFKEKRPLCFVNIGFFWPVAYFKWVKKRWPDSKTVVFLRDLVSTHKEYYRPYLENGVIDFWVSFDPIDAEKYKMYFHNEICSKISLKKTEKKYDVFFAGRAKRRLPRIIEVYDKLEKSGVNCFFYINGAAEEEKVERKGITYSDRYLTYREMLEYNNESKCILEICQDFQAGYTSRFLEAVMYDNRLLTDNNALKDSPFFDDRFIQCFEKPDDIDTDFIFDETPVAFNYKGEFSPKHFIEFLDNTVLR